MKQYKLRINPQALEDIQQAIDFYNLKQAGLGKRFHASVLKTIDLIRKNPLYQVRYDDVRCILVKKFPYMIHFNILDNNVIIIVRAVFHTSIDPDKWLKR